MMATADDIVLTVSWFPCAIAKGGPALGDPETMTWKKFCDVIRQRREGVKDGPGFVPSRFCLESDGRQVRRVGRNLIARTVIALDIETNRKTGKIPPSVFDSVKAVRSAGWACALYTSHSHKKSEPRYRMVFPISAEMAHELPVSEIVARQLGLDDVLDRGKIGPASFFYTPSQDMNAPDDLHETHIIAGRPIDAQKLTVAAGIVLAEKQAEADRLAAAANAEAQQRREARLAQGFDPDDSLIDRIRAHLDLPSVLTTHGYAQAGTLYRHPNSQSGSFGASVKIFGGVERVFSHNATDPLHKSNLPAWCNVSAVDAFDVTTILDYGGDRKKALSELAQKFGMTKTAERKEAAGVMFRLIRQQASQQEFERVAASEAQRLGLSIAEIAGVAAWCAEQVVSGNDGQ